MRQACLTDLLRPLQLRVNPSAKPHSNRRATRQSKQNAHRQQEVHTGHSSIGNPGHSLIPFVLAARRLYRLARNNFHYKNYRHGTQKIQRLIYDDAQPLIDPLLAVHEQVYSAASLLATLIT